MSSFNIFGPATKKDIRVGYIDPDAGYVQNVSVLEANKYAALNPGTVFIFTNRDRTRYLTINEVNALTPEDLNVDSNGCEGIRGLQPNERAPFTILRYMTLLLTGQNCLDTAIDLDPMVII